MDWDVEPTAFSEYVTIGAKGGQLPPEVVAALGADAWSLAEPDVPDGATTGEPNTFAFGLRFNRPIPVLARGLDAGTVREAEPARRDGQVRQ